MSDRLVYFLIVFNLRSGELERCDEIAEVDEAVAAFAEAEQRHLGRGYEVVLVGAESLETVMITHGAYFERAPVVDGQALLPRAGLSLSISAG